MDSPRDALTELGMSSIVFTPLELAMLTHKYLNGIAKQAAHRATTTSASML